MHGPTPTEGPSAVESGPSAQPQYSSHNYPPPNNPPGVINPNVPAYGPPPPVTQHQYPPPPPAPFAAHGYPPPAPFSFYGTGPGTPSSPRQRNSIACRSCRKRKIRCGGKGNTAGGKCLNCFRRNQECIFSDIKPVSAFVPVPFGPRFAPPYGPFGEPFVHEQYQNHDVNTSGYGTNPNSTQDDYPQRSTFRPSLDHGGGYRDGLRPLYGQRQDDPDSLKAYAAPGGSLQGITPSLSDKRAMKEPIKLPDPARLRNRSPTPSSSPTVSSDIDVDSISADSEGQLDRNIRGYRVFSRVFSRLAVLGQNEVTARGESSCSSSKGKQVAKGGSGSSSMTRDTASTKGGRKNPRQGDDNGDESRDRQNEPPKKKGKTSQPSCDERSRFLACPYWKADSRKYWDCFLKKNDTIAHLKQHLTRRHTPKYYCQVCYETFRDFYLFDSHALERSCTRGPSAKLEGISQQQKNQLSLKSKGSVEQQWYTVWSILFPDMEPPATIYIYSTQSEDFCRIQEFAQREGVSIMLDELESNGLVVRPDASDQLLRSTVQRAMVSIFRSYSVRREPSSDVEEPIPGQALEPDRGVSLLQESDTEGQIGHGNHPTSGTDTEQKYIFTIANHNSMAS
ncbi:hypothetical protein FMUND_11425 [Fusarium mundagurra]|uniref:Zn(2)-C6 fungal-type domain-containing protein n=1 Tax=Fusarium mundagurra TaxID=1567541 RepID=A0A8H5Y6S3_9HYPO|nr:hypothetical protein FMUND_11425 [Fusarium mundagurra]